MKQYYFAKKSTKEENELPHLINSLHNKLKSGSSPFAFLQSYISVKSPYKRVIENILKRIKTGSSISKAFELASSETYSYYSKFFFNSISFSINNGSNLTDITKNLMESINEKIKNRRIIQSKTIQLKLQAYVVCLLPLLSVCYMTLTNPFGLNFITNTHYGFRYFITMITVKISGIVLINMMIARVTKLNCNEELPTFLNLLSTQLKSGRSIIESIYNLKEITISEKVSNFALQFEKSLHQGRSIDSSLDLIQREFPNYDCEKIKYLINENLQYGMQLSPILDALSKELTLDLQSQTLLKIERLPIKLLAPLMLLIAPAALGLILMPLIFR